MADPQAVQDFIQMWGLSDSVFLRERINDMMDRGLAPSDILAELGAGNELVGQAQGLESLGLETGGFAPARGGMDLNFGTPAASFDVPLPPPPEGALQRNEIGGFLNDLFGQGMDIARGFAQDRAAEAEAALTPFDRAFLALQAQFPGALITEAPDGRIQVSSGGDVLFFDALESGQPFLVQRGLDRDPSNRTGTGAGRAPARPQFQGVDPRTGRAIIFDPNTGGISLGEQVGFAGIDPQREFGLREQEQGRRGAETTRDILSSGRNFLAAAYLSRRGQLPGFSGQGITQADQLNALQAGGLPGQTQAAPGFAPSRATLDRAGINEQLSQTGRADIRPQAQAEPDLTTQEGLFDLARQTAGPAVSAILEGEGVPQFNLSNIPLPSPQELGKLTEDELGALDTTLQNNPDNPITLDELIQQQQRAFRAPSRRTRGFARIV